MILDLCVHVVCVGLSSVFTVFDVGNGIFCGTRLRCCILHINRETVKLALGMPRSVDFRGGQTAASVL